MPLIETEIEVYCSCGNGLCGQSKVANNRRGQAITVEPCQKCLDAAKEEGAKDGYNEGYEKGEVAAQAGRVM